MKNFLYLASVTFLFSCTQLPEPVNGWIDIPLSDNTFSESVISYKSGAYEIPIYAYEALEFQVAILENDTVNYEWSVDMDSPELLDVEFHGHTDRIGDEPGLLMYYKVHNDGEGVGTLKAPFNGIHGWYFNNRSEEDIVIILNLSGFYTESEQ